MAFLSFILLHVITTVYVWSTPHPETSHLWPFSGIELQNPIGFIRNDSTYFFISAFLYDDFQQKYKTEHNKMIRARYNH